MSTRLVLDRQTIDSQFPSSPATASVRVEKNDAGQQQLRVSLVVNDRSLREKLGADGDKFNGLESPVALVVKDGEYQRFPMRFIASTGGAGMAPSVDHYELLLGEGQYDFLAQITRGVGLMLETNVGEIALQGLDDNRKFDPVQ